MVQNVNFGQLSTWLSVVANSMRFSSVGVMKKNQMNDVIEVFQNIIVIGLKDVMNQFSPKFKFLGANTQIIHLD